MDPLVKNYERRARRYFLRRILCNLCSLRFGRRIIILLVDIRWLTRSQFVNCGELSGLLPWEL